MIWNPGIIMVHIWSGDTPCVLHTAPQRLVYIDTEVNCVLV